MENGEKINQEQEDEMEIYGYNLCRWKLALVAVGVLCTGGFLLLLLYWMPKWRVKATCTRITLKECDVVLLRTTDEFRTWFCAKVRIRLCPGTDPFQSPESIAGKTLNGHTGHLPESPTEHHEDHAVNATAVPLNEVRYFVHHSVTYYWNDLHQAFNYVTGLDDRASCAAIHTEHSKGLSKELHEYRYVAPFSSMN